MTPFLIDMAVGQRTCLWVDSTSTNGINTMLHRRHSRANKIRPRVVEVEVLKWTFCLASRGSRIADSLHQLRASYDSYDSARDHTIIVDLFACNRNR
jgi:hypothetical protein